MAGQTARALLPRSGIAEAIRRRIAEEVRDMFNDRARGEQPVARRADGLFGPSSAIWRVHGDVTSMMIGGIAALLLQMLHPAVLAGVWDHSRFRDDRLGRLRRTARFIALTTYGGREEAVAAIAEVRAIHGRVRGVLPDGRAYAASDPRLLAWVHVTEAQCFLDGWRRYGEPAMPPAEQDRYFAEMAVIGRALGADPVPLDRAQAAALIAAMRPELACDARAREVARLLLGTPAQRLSAEPFQRLLQAAAVDLLPAWARAMHGFADPPRALHGFADPPRALPFVRSAATGLARTLRWAFR